MFGGLLPSYTASQPWSVTHVMFRMRRPTKRAIKVISTLSRFATVERETIKRKTLKIWVNFGVAAPRPWGKNQKINPPIALVNTGENRNLLEVTGFPDDFPPILP